MPKREMVDAAMLSFPASAVQSATSAALWPSSRSRYADLAATYLVSHITLGTKIQPHGGHWESCLHISKPISFAGSDFGNQHDNYPLARSNYGELRYAGGRLVGKKEKHVNTPPCCSGQAYMAFMCFGSKV